MDPAISKLNNVDHATLQVVAEYGSKWGDTRMTCLVLTSEMRSLQGSYPMLFQLTPESENPLPVALMGFEQGENLFVSEAGWSTRTIPLMMQKGPFLIASERDQTAQEQSVIAIDENHPKLVQEGGEALFLEHGGYSPYLEKVINILERIEASHSHTLAFAHALNEKNLVTGIDLKVNDAAGKPHVLSGFFGIDEDRVAALGGDELGELHAQGYLAPLFMILASQAQLTRLLTMKHA